MSEKNDEQSQTLARITSGVIVFFMAIIHAMNKYPIYHLERDMIKSEMRTLSETFEKQTIENGE